MTTQNLNTGPLRSSGHKEPTEEHATVSQLHSQGEDGNPGALLQNRLLKDARVSRAALFDHDDFLCVASSKQRFDIEPDGVRKILDGLLTAARQGDPTFASGDGQPPTKLHIGAEGTADVKQLTGDYILCDFKGKPFVAARTATYVLLVEAAEGDTNEAALVTSVETFQNGLQSLTL